MAACALLAGCGKSPPPKPPPPTVGVVVIKPEPVQLTAELPGRTDPFAVSDIRPQVGGILQKRLFTEGAIVHQGDPLYQIDPAPYQAALSNAQAVLTTTHAKMIRYTALVKLGAVAPQDYDDAVAAYKQALANVQTAKINLSYTRITAPITGRIRPFAGGRKAALLTADQSTAIATIQTLDPIYVDITQSSVELLNLKLAMEGGKLTNGGPASARATLTLDNGTALFARRHAAIPAKSRSTKRLAP